MQDRITTARTVRLQLHVSQTSSPLAPWALSSISTRRGVPDARVLQLGYVPLTPMRPTEADIWEALDRIVGQYTLH